jgi:hypothetical protein
LLDTDQERIMRLDISRISRILPILSILILGGFQTTSALEYLITGSPGGQTRVGDITYQQGDTASPIQLYVYLRYTASEVTASGGTGWLSGNMQFGSSDSTIAYMNGAAPSTLISQLGVYEIQNVGATGTTTNNWQNGVVANFSDLGTITANYYGNYPDPPNTYSNTYGTDAVNYLYLATVTLTIDTSIIGTASIGATKSGDWFDDVDTRYSAIDGDSFNITVNAVPEPTTYALAALSCVALGVAGRRKSLKAKKQETASA